MGWGRVERGGCVASEPVGRRSRATELPCFVHLFVIM